MEAVDLTADSPGPQATSCERCPVCDASVQITDIAAHCEAHFAEGSAELRESDDVLCDLCGLEVRLGDLDSHELAHSMDLRADGEAEHREWQQLRQRYGFDAGPRQGECYLCGQPGHWAPECPRSAAATAAQARIVSPPTRDAVATAQRPDPQWAAGGAAAPAQLIGLIAACLREQQAPPGCHSVTSLLCSPVSHFGGRRDDAGWGCGYRNMQMLASSVLATRPAAAAALFGGAGFVPDIASLQAWIECAWREGFDAQGADQLGHSLQAQHKWVGTTEAAAMLRLFGLQTTIVDFGVAGGGAADWKGASIDAARPQGDGGGGGGAADGPKQRLLEVHVGVACDGCGAVGFVGPRYCSEVLPDFDLCGACHRSGGHPAAAPFRRVAAPCAGASDVARSGAAAGGGAEQAGSAGPTLLEWVWRYFAAGDAAGADGSAAAAGAPAAGLPGGKRARVSDSAGASEGGVKCTACPPLYFQHEGHSRTIVGIERRQGGGPGGRKAEHTLLILDPAHAPAQLSAALRSRQGWQRLLKRGAPTLRHAQYQLLYCPDVPLAPPGSRLYESLKTIAAAERYA